MGHSALRPSHTIDDGFPPKMQKRLELLPEEALYAIERGSMLCYKQAGGLDNPVSANGEDSDDVPMTIQQAYAELIGLEDLTLEKYQVSSGFTGAEVANIDFG